MSIRSTAKVEKEYLGCKWQWPFTGHGHGATGNHGNHDGRRARGIMLDFNCHACIMAEAACKLQAVTPLFGSLLTVRMGNLHAYSESEISLQWMALACMKQLCLGSRQLRSFSICLPTGGPAVEEAAPLSSTCGYIRAVCQRNNLSIVVRSPHVCHCCG